MRRLMIVALAALLAACSPPGAGPASAQPDEAASEAAAPEADAPAGLADAAAPKLGGDDARTLVEATGYMAGPDGTVQNLCGERVSPQTLPADVGGSVGLAWLFIVPGGPNTATCYGDAPGDLYLMVRSGDSWRRVFKGAGYLAILPATGTDGVHDISLGGPGFEFPVFTWNGNNYVDTDRTISDTEFAAATMLP